MAFNHMVNWLRDLLASLGKTELRMFFAFLVLWIFLFAFAYREVLGSGQFVFSEQDALSDKADSIFLHLFIHAWNPYGYGAVVPSGLQSFYETTGWSYASGLGAFWSHPPSYFFMGLLFSVVLTFTENLSLLQHSLYFPLLPLSGVTMYILLRKFSFSFICRFVSCFVYAVNPITIMAFLGGGPHKMALYASQPLIVLFLLNILEENCNKLRNIIMLSIFSALASSLAFPLYSVTLVLIPTITFIFLKRDKKYTLVSFVSVLVSFLLTFLLILPYSFSIFWQLISKDPLSVFSSVSAKYEVESLLGGIEYVYAASSLENLVRIQFFINPPSWWFGGTSEWNLFGFILPILAFASLLLLSHADKIKARRIIVFNVMTLLPIMFNWLTHLGYTYSLFTSFPVLFVYNAPEYMLWITLVAYAPLIAFTLDGLKKKLTPVAKEPLFAKVSPGKYIVDAKRLKHSITFVLVMLLSISFIAAYSWPFFTGDFGLVALAEERYQVNSEEHYIIPSVYYEMREWIKKANSKNEAFRVLMLPYTYETHYAATALEDLQVNVLPPPPRILDDLTNERTDRIGAPLGLLGVKYIFVNIASPSTGAGLPSVYLSPLAQQKDLKLLENNTRFAVFENENFVPSINVYDKGVFLASAEGNVSPIDQIAMLAVTPGFNMKNQLLFFGGNPSSDETRLALSKVDTLVFFGANYSAFEEYANLSGYNIKNVLQIFKAGNDLTYASESIPGGLWAARFDGETGYIKILPSDSLNMNYTQMTISVWVNPMVPTDGKTIYSNPSPSYGGYFRWQLDDRWYVFSQELSGPPDQGMVPTSNVPPNEWSLKTVVFNGTHLLDFLNGKLKNVGYAHKGYFNVSGSHFIGSYLGGANFFSGYMRNLQIYKRALDQAEIEKLYASGISGSPDKNKELVAWWALNQSSDSIVFDYSGNNNTGEIIGGVTWEMLAGSVRPKNMEASLGYCLDTAVWGEITSYAFALQNGTYEFALRAKTDFAIKLLIDENSEIDLVKSDYQKGSFDWYIGSVYLRKGVHKIEVESSAGSSFLDELITCYSAPESYHSSFKDLFSLSQEISFSVVQSSWTHCSLNISSQRPSFILLLQTFHPAWSASIGNAELYHFNATLWANGFIMPNTGVNSVEIYFREQTARNNILLIWSFSWFAAISSSVYLCRKELRARARQP